MIKIRLKGAILFCKFLHENRFIKTMESTTRKPTKFLHSSCVRLYLFLKLCHNDCSPQNLVSLTMTTIKYPLHNILFFILKYKCFLLEYQSPVSDLNWDGVKIFMVPYLCIFGRLKQLSTFLLKMQISISGMF